MGNNRNIRVVVLKGSSIYFAKKKKKNIKERAYVYLEEVREQLLIKFTMIKVAGENNFLSFSLSLFW